MPTRKGENQTIREAEGPAGGAAGNVEVVQPAVGAIPPGALPQVNLESGTSADAEPFLAPAPRSNGTIRGYGHARVGRVPPHGGSPSSGPLTGLPLQTRRPPPVPPVLRRQALEPGHREPDPFLKIPAFDPDPRLPAEILLEGIEGIARSAAALRSVPEPRRGGAGRHGPLVGAASPAGSGGARVAASVGVPLAESVRTSDRGLYVAGRASGARWDSNGKVAPRPPATDRCAAPGSAARGRPLTHLQSVVRYARHQQAVGDKLEESSSETPASGIPPPVQAQSAGAGAVSRVASKGVSPAFKGLSKAQAPARSFAGMEGRQGDEGDAKPDPDRERRLLAGRAMLQGIGGRFGARSRCHVDPTQALRPAPGLAELRREGESAQKLKGAHADAQPDPRAKHSAGAAPAKPSDASRTRRGPAAVQPRAGECAVAPQKYAAEAGVRMRDTGAATAAMPPDGAAGATVDGVPTERQAPWGQAGPADRGGSGRHALEELSPGDAGAAAHGLARAPAFSVDARGMGGASAPVLLDVDQRLRAEAEAKVRARESAETLTREIDAYLATARDSATQQMLSAMNAYLKTSLEAAFRDPDRLDGGAAASGWFKEADRLVLRIGRSRELLEAGADLAAARLATMAVAADQAEAAASALRSESEGLSAASRVLGNMDRETLSRRSGEAARRAEREMFRAERRALRRERNGAFLVRQLVKAEAAYERSTALDARADRYRRKAVAKRPGAERDRAMRKADHYGSLAEHERNRAARAQTHAVGAAAGGLKGWSLSERRRADSRADRDERETIRLSGAWRAQQSQLGSVQGEIGRLVVTGKWGVPVRDAKGNYIPLRRSDALRVGTLARKEARLKGALSTTGGRIAAVGRTPLESVQAQLGQLATTDASGNYIPVNRSDSFQVRVLARREARLRAEEQARREKAMAAGRAPLESVQAELGRLATVDANGNYAPLRKSDSFRVRVLARKQRRLAAEQHRKEQRKQAGPGSRKDDAGTLVARRDALLLKIALAPSMLATAQGRKGMPPVRQMQAWLRATQHLVNIKMSEQIKDASGQAEAALAAGRRAALARYDQTLPESDRAEAARVHEAALAVATRAVEKIASLIKNKTYKSKKERERDDDKLARAREIVRLLDPCNSDACADARDKCKDRPPEYCEFKLRRQPRPFGDPVPRGEPGGAQDLGRPSGSEDAAVMPGGSEESDGEDEKDETVKPSGSTSQAPPPVKTEDSDTGEGEDLLDRVGQFAQQLASATGEAAADAVDAVQSALETAGGFVESFAKSVQMSGSWNPFDFRDWGDWLSKAWQESSPNEQPSNDITSLVRRANRWIAGLADAYAVAKIDRTVDLATWNSGLQDVLVKLFVTGVTERLQHGYTLEQAESEAVGDVEGVDRIWRRALGKFPYGPKPDGIPDLDYGPPLVQLPSGEWVQVKPLAENRALRIGERAIRGVGEGFLGAVAGLGDLLGIATPFSDDLLALDRADLTYSASLGRIGTPEKIAGVAGAVAPYVLIPGSAFATPLRAVATGGVIGLVTTEGGAKEKTVATLVGMASFGLGSKLKQAASRLYVELLGGTATRFAPYVVNPVLDTTAFTAVAAVEQQFRPEEDRVSLGDLYLGNLLGVTVAHGMGLGIGNTSWDAQRAGRRAQSPFELYMRGTTKDWPGNPALLELRITPTTLDARKAIVFALDASRKGEAVVHVATSRDLVGVARAPAPDQATKHFEVLESAVWWKLFPGEFAQRASLRDIPLRDAQAVLQGLGHDVTVYIDPNTSSWLARLPAMTEDQVQALAQAFYEGVKGARR